MSGAKCTKGCVLDFVQKQNQNQVSNCHNWHQALRLKEVLTTKMRVSNDTYNFFETRVFTKVNDDNKEFILKILVSMDPFYFTRAMLRLEF
jgi:hypothetical protein